MAIKHVVRCDGAGCDTEQDLLATVGAASLTGTAQYVTTSSYSVPLEWKQIDGRQFCSWRCLGLYAEQRTEARQP